MSVIALIIVVVLLGLIAYGVSIAPFIVGWAKTICYVILFIVAVLLVLQAFGLLDEIRGIQVPRL